MTIYGAGMSGLLAANMLRRFKPVIHEAQPGLPNNHEALLRFRTDSVSKATGIPFKRVEVQKSIRYKGRTIGHPDIQLNNLYSHKVAGEYRARSIGDMRSGERFIAPPDFIAQMARTCHIEYNSPLTIGEVQRDDNSIPIISTVPMPALMKMVQWDDQPEFKFSTIWSKVITITQPHCEVYQTIYYPDPDVPYYRASITGNRLIIEYCSNPTEAQVGTSIMNILDDFGVKVKVYTNSATKEQRYGKLVKLDNESERRRFLICMTDEYNVYSLGRFATWRQILMDDVVSDVTTIERLIADGSTYTRRLE